MTKLLAAFRTSANSIKNSFIVMYAGPRGQSKHCWPMGQEAETECEMKRPNRYFKIPSPKWHGGTE